MAKKLKVFGVNYRGTARRIVAATSQFQAALLMDVTLGYLREYGGITGNSTEMQLCLNSPGDVFECSTRGYPHEYFRIDTE